MERYNVIVLGAGSGGLTVAAGAAALGARVALLEAHRMGGDCLNYGCVPSKALLHVAKVAHTVRTAAGQGVVGVPPLPAQDLARVMAYVREAQARIAPHDSVERFTGLGVDVRLEAGRLLSAHEVELSGTKTRLWGRHIVLATGSRPRIPKIRGLDDVGYLTNETVFDATQLPAALVVVGGGPIGVELGQAFARLGSAVTIVSGSDHILPREDTDVADVLARRLRAEGVTVLDRARAAWAAGHNGRKQLGVETPEGERAIVVDEILVAAGRQPNTHGLGLEAVGVALDERGVKIDRACRTSVSSVWAIGDVAGPYQFTHWANYQARVLLRNALFPGSSSFKVDAVPWTTFTQPEVARVGLSEAEAIARGVPHDVFRAPFDDNDRAICDSATEGFVKVITQKGRGRVLGAAVVHSQAGELLAELSVAVRHRIPLSRLSSTVHVYPTLSEAVRAAADQYMRGKLRPGLKAVLGHVFQWLRR